MTKQDEFDFTQFKGQFDSAMSPDSDFAERMKLMLERESGGSSQDRKSTVLASPSRSGNNVPVPGRRTHPLTIAASILVVLAVVVSSVWVLSGTQLEGEYGSAPSGIATLPADAEMTPGADVSLSDELVIPFEANSYSNPYTIAVIDGVAYTSRTGPSTSSLQDTHAEFVTAWDTDTGEKLWEIEGYSLWNLELSDGVLVAFRSLLPPPEQHQDDTEFWPSISLIALDADTGEELWQRGITDAEAFGNWQMQYITVADLVIAVDPEGAIYGLNSRSGEQVWESTFDPGTPQPTELQRGSDSIFVDMYSFTMIEWNGQIAIANGDGVIQTLDPTNGDMVSTHQVGEKSSLGYLSLNPLPNGLLLTHGGKDYQMVAYEPESGQMLWERELEGDVQVNVAENGMIAVNSHVWESGNFIMRLIGRGGHSTYQFHWIDGATGNEALVTERGRVDGSAFSVTDGEYLCTRTDEWVCYDQAGTRHVIANGPWSQAFLENGALYFDREDGVYRVELP